jgi:hypothetical protein
MSKLEAGQVWVGTIQYKVHSKLTCRKIVKTSQGRRELLLHYAAKTGLGCCYERTFRAWIERTGATLQEPQ